MFNVPFILESFEFKLKNSTSVSDNENCLQFAPTYSNLTMGYHEIKFYDITESTSNLDIRQYFVKNWKRFIDDCEILLNKHRVTC